MIIRTGPYRLLVSADWSVGWYWLFFAFIYLAVPVMHFIALELGVCLRVMAWRCCFLTILAHLALITLLCVVIVVYVAMEATLTMVPLTSANEDTAIEPFRSVVAGLSTVIRW